jgi:hypothetical protein
MARRVKKFPKNVGRIHNKSMYPWMQWLDGSVWVLDVGKDFKVKPQSFRSLAATTAQKHGKKVRIAVRNKHLYMQAFKPNGYAKRQAAPSKIGAVNPKRVV